MIPYFVPNFISKEDVEFLENLVQATKQILLLMILLVDSLMEICVGFKFRLF